MEGGEMEKSDKIQVGKRNERKKILATGGGKCVQVMRERRRELRARVDQV